MNLYEYDGIVDVKDISKISNYEAILETDEKEGPGRRHNKIFKFTDEHPLYETKVQVLRSKFRVPMLNRCSPPKWPSPNANITQESRQQKEELHANFMSTLLEPWGDDGRVSSFHRDEWIEKVNNWSLKNATAIEKGRYGLYNRFE